MHIFNIHSLLLFCLTNLSVESSEHLPRMTFNDREIPFQRLHFHGHHKPILTLQEGQPDIVIGGAEQHLYSFHFQSPKKAVGRNVLWKECTDKEATPEACHYNITVLHKREKANELFLCGTNSKGSTCCNMNMTGQSPMCTSSEHMMKIKTSLKEFRMKQGEPSILSERGEHADLYITHSGAQDCVGIHKFGENRVEPTNQRKEQQYVSLVPSTRIDNPLHSKIYAFYKERNTEDGFDSDMWVPFVAQVCMGDKGGPKSYRQFLWTSQLNARLYCGDHSRRQHYPELVDVATVHADRWQDTRVYALFRNEWGMTAVCVYTIHDIDWIFTHSGFKGYSASVPKPRPGTCVKDSTALPREVMRIATENSEMEDRVLPLNNTGPLLVSHHHYTHISVDSFHRRGNYQHTVLFLSLENGRIHKVMENGNQAFFIAEYAPFNHKAHILSMILHSTARKLYVSSSSEVVQLDVGNCEHYGDSCEECILARDPYCGWSRGHCTSETHDTQTLQDLENGNHTKCKSKDPITGKASRYSSVGDREEAVDSITLPLQAKYFLQCPMSSHHAEYTWHHHKNTTSCSPIKQQCVLLIDSMGPDQEGTYSCVSEEMGYTRTLAQYQLHLDRSAADPTSSPLAWLCLMVVLLVQGI